MENTPEAKALRELRKEGKQAVVSLEALIDQLDTTYKLPPGAARDKTIATLTSKLEYAKDCLKRFGLKMELGRPASKQAANPIKGKPTKLKLSPSASKALGVSLLAPAPAPNKKLVAAMKRAKDAAPTPSPSTR